MLADADPDTLPSPNSISAGVHAKGKTLLDCVTDLAGALGIAAPAMGWEYPGSSSPPSVTRDGRWRSCWTRWMRPILRTRPRSQPTFCGR